MAKQIQAADDFDRLLKVDQACEILQVSHTHLYALLSSGALGSISIGRSRRIPASAIAEYVQTRLNDQDGQR